MMRFWYSSGLLVLAGASQGRTVPRLLLPAFVLAVSVAATDLASPFGLVKKNFVFDTVFLLCIFSKLHFERQLSNFRRNAPFFMQPIDMLNVSYLCLRVGLLL